jgi:Rrf2 family transcriptional regulator, iron-sulfur cluster assembly transcription factor
MIALSQTTGYAIQALSCIHDPACRRPSITAIASCSSVPRPYLAKIVNALVRAGLVTSKRGVGGGIALARAPGKITLLQIVEAIEGPQWLGDCLLGMNDCASDEACPTHVFWTRIRAEITGELIRTTLADVISYRARRAGCADPPASCAPKRVRGRSVTVPRRPLR